MPWDGPRDQHGPAAKSWLLSQGQSLFALRFIFEHGVALSGVHRRFPTFFSPALSLDLLWARLKEEQLPAVRARAE